MSIFKRLLVVSALVTAPASAMAFTASPADACWICNPARRWECYTGGANGAQYCTPQTNHASCILTGVCLG